MKRTTNPLSIIAAALSLLALYGHGAPHDDSDIEKLLGQLKQPWLEVGASVQAQAQYQSERTFAGEDGFSMENARVLARGQFDNGFGYFLQTNFVRSPALLDARLSYTHRPHLVVDAGQFKAPFSQEFLTPAGELDFISRSQGVTVLAPARQIGVDARGRFGQGWRYAAGVFNGNGIGANRNDDSGLMGVARLDREFAAFNGEMKIGVNLAHSDDAQASLGATIGGDPLISDFEGTRALAGIDARWQGDLYRVSGEFIYGDIDPIDASTLEIYGFHITAGRKIGARSEVLIRFDRLSTDRLDEDSDLVLLGFNIDPVRLFKVRVNLVIPTDGADLDSTQIKAHLQLML